MIHLEIAKLGKPFSVMVIEQKFFSTKVLAHYIEHDRANLSMLLFVLMQQYKNIHIKYKEGIN